MTTLPFAGRGTLLRHEVPTPAGPPRTVDVWLPPDDGAPAPAGGRPVVVAHDGQNLFRADDGFSGNTWRLHEAALEVARSTGVPVPVLVGVWNSVGVNARRAEYLAPEPELTPYGSGIEGAASLLKTRKTRAADVYVRFLVEHVLPLVEAEYGVATHARGRTVLGSSMGGLASLYCALARPDVFGAAGCVSTHWVIGGDALVDWFAARLPGPGWLRLWFDRGTTELDAEYGPGQDRMDAALRASSLVEGEDWVSRVYPGTGHNERDWAARAPEVLAFLLAGR